MTLSVTVLAATCMYQRVRIFTTVYLIFHFSINAHLCLHLSGKARIRNLVIKTGRSKGTFFRRIRNLVIKTGRSKGTFFICFGHGAISRRHRSEGKHWKKERTLSKRVLGRKPLATLPPPWTKRPEYKLYILLGALF